ncbi:MAG: adenylate/guanylate cyclase domain-containing protein [Deltaproteobacteria bacterium]|nr:adenylate/guanylate cyclase domain-containing protein [Deltaproteobacteria bacterium]
MSLFSGAKGRRLWAAITAGAAVGAVAALFAGTRPSLMERGEHWTFDLRTRVSATPTRASPAIVIVDISERDIKDAQKNFEVTWPWPRAMYGYLTEFATKAGARALVFDWLFQDQGQYGVSDAEEFAAAMKASHKVVIGLALHRGGAVAAADAETHIRNRDGIVLPPSMTVHAPVLDGMDPPLFTIAAAARTGNVYQDPEEDGIFRRHAPFVVSGGKLFPSLAMAAWNAGLLPGQGAAYVSGRTLVVGERRITLDDEGRFAIRFHGADVYPHLSSYEILRSKAMLDEGILPAVPLSALRDKFVVVSASGHALRDVRSSAISRSHQGSGINAAALDNLLSGDAIRRVPPSTDAMLAFLLCLFASILVSALWSWIERPMLALATTGASTFLFLAGFGGISFVLFDQQGLWIATAAPMTGAAMAAFISVLTLSASERRGRRFVQEALGRYTSKALVRELTEHPEYLSLEWGQRKELSVYFSDIAGFTTISESLSPEKLVALLNDYLTEMTDIVLAHGGIVDKYIGDAVMAFWGAPLADPLHAQRAVAAAVAMRKRCEELRPRWQERFGVTVAARAGVNSGVAVAGNMGSRHKYNYTVMGDMVNLASRLEGANKAYGTYLMISEFTLAATEAHAPGQFEVRELDLLVVKGKEKPVRVFEVLGMQGATPEALTRASAVYREGLEHYRKQDFAGATAKFEMALTIVPDDGPCKTYLERCRHFGDNPPGAEWDGVWHMHEK